MLGSKRINDALAARANSPLSADKREERCFDFKFKTMLTGEVEQQLTSNYSRMKRNCDKSVSELQTKLKFAGSIDPRKHGIGSKGGHIARRMQSPGPLNSYFEPQVGTYVTTHDKFFATLHDNLKYQEAFKVENPDWDSQFVCHDSLAIRPVYKHPPKIRPNPEFEASMMPYRCNTTSKRQPKPIENKSRYSDQVEVLRAKGKEAYVLKALSRGGRSRGNSAAGGLGSSGSFMSSLDSESGAEILTVHERDVEGESVSNSLTRTLSVGDGDDAVGGGGGGGGTGSLASLNTDGLHQSISSPGESPTSGRSVASSPDRGDRGPPSIKQIFKIEAELKRLLRGLTKLGSLMDLTDIEEICMQCVDPPHAILPLLCYLCVLMGLSPNLKCSVDLFSKDAEVVLEFIREVEPLVVSLRRVRKAFELKSRLMSHWNDDFIDRLNPSVAKLAKWVNSFNEICDLVIAVYRVRRLMQSNSQMSMVSQISSDSFLSQQQQISDSFEFDDHEASLLYMTRQFCMDLARDRSCTWFWMRLDSKLEDARAEAAMEDEDVSYLESSVASEFEDGLFSPVDTAAAARDDESAAVDNKGRDDLGAQPPPPVEDGAVLVGNANPWRSLNSADSVRSEVSRSSRGSSPNPTPYRLTSQGSGSGLDSLLVDDTDVSITLGTKRAYDLPDSLTGGTRGMFLRYDSSNSMSSKSTAMSAGSGGGGGGGGGGALAPVVGPGGRRKNSFSSIISKVSI